MPDRFSVSAMPFIVCQPCALYYCEPYARGIVSPMSFIAVSPMPDRLSVSSMIDRLSVKPYARSLVCEPYALQGSLIFERNTLSDAFAHAATNQPSEVWRLG
ncbi:hypothetical protein CEXT_333271 [Caerostris extrusa]|uniref:Uncharacterized protein n=1 Tax=Caerostris extrusa TaxID=172846 RepID=A0AAV4PXB5_CAEEX|nr:hypothetical protein CEXT_333271 [Caerostris extrusa]